MSQHLYPCERTGCGKVGIAHYILLPNPDTATQTHAPYLLARLCKGCWKGWGREQERLHRQAAQQH